MDSRDITRLRKAASIMAFTSPIEFSSLDLRTLEVELGEKKYFGGEDFGLVDVALVPFTSWFYSFKAFAKLSVKGKCPKLAAWAKRCMVLESVAKSLPEPQKVHELFRARMKELGVE